MQFLCLNFNYWAIIVSAIAFFALGSLWYTKILFGDAWVASMGKTMEQLEKEKANVNMTKSFGIMFLSGLLMAFELSAQGKSDREVAIALNSAGYQAIQNHIASLEKLALKKRNSSIVDDDAYLFTGQRGLEALKVSTLNNMVKSWCRNANLKGNYGAHTLRKTWGYIQRTEFGVGFEVIAKRYNHSNPAVTMKYLGIEDKEVHGTLMNEIG